MTEGNFCPRCGHSLDEDQTPVSAAPATGPLPPTLPEDRHPEPDVIPAQADEMGPAGDVFQPIEIPDLSALAPRDDAAPDDTAPRAISAPEDDAAPEEEDADAGPVDEPEPENVAAPDAEATPEDEAQPDAGSAVTPVLDIDEHGDIFIGASSPLTPEDDRAGLPTTRLNPIETAADAAPPDAPPAPDTSSPEGGPEQDETGEFATGNWSESIETAPDIAARPDDQETMPEVPSAPPAADKQDADEDHGPKTHPWLAELAEASDTHPRLDERPPDMADTMPRLTGDLLQPTEEFDTTGWPAKPSPLDVTSPALSVKPKPAPAPTTTIPPAPFTPPPIPDTVAPTFIAPPAPYAPAPYAPYMPGYAPSPAMQFMQQRVQLYQRDRYRVVSHTPNEIVLSRGKQLGVSGWLVALVSIVGVFWYTLILLVSGFRRDRVFVTLEADGYVYEDGPGAAHVRQQRSRGGRRWSIIGLVLFVLSFLLAAGLAIAATVTASQDRYQAALREAYPAITLFEEHFTAGDADPADVDLMHDGLVAWSIAGGIALVGLWGGLTLFIVGYIHATAYRVNVPPLPGMR